VTVIDTQCLRELMDYEAARDAPPAGFPPLPPIPSERYTDPVFYQLEQQYLSAAAGYLRRTLMSCPNRGVFNDGISLAHPLSWCVARTVVSAH